MVIVCSIWSDRIHMRSPFVMLALALSAIGYGINISNAGIGAKYFGTFLVVIGAYSGFPATSAWYVLHLVFPRTCTLMAI